MCFGCGLENQAGLQIRFFTEAPGVARAEVVLHDHHQGYPGIAHGGVVATMLDEVMGRAPLAGDSRRLMFTAKMEVRYRLPVPLHIPLTLRGWIEKDRGRLVTAAAELLLPDGTVAAEATGTLTAIPAEQLHEMDTEAAGWRVYPLE
jgi:acyl-coenzyme A thioesterase PaaI-like protein